jgi:hypothetical protein
VVPVGTDVALYGQGLVVVDGSANGDRFLNIAQGARVEMRYLSIKNFEVLDDGGAVRNAGELSLESVQLSYNKAIRGAGVFNTNTGRVAMSLQTFSRNFALREGGDVHNAGFLSVPACDLTGDLSGLQQTCGSGDARRRMNLAASRQGASTVSAITWLTGVAGQWPIHQGYCSRGFRLSGLAPVLRFGSGCFCRRERGFRFRLFVAVRPR